MPGTLFTDKLIIGSNSKFDSCYPAIINFCNEICPYTNEINKLF